MQVAQSIGARLLTKSTMYHQHVTLVLIQLHWLPIHFRGIIKILVLTFRVPQEHTPVRMREILYSYVPSRSLRSCDWGLQGVQDLSH